METGTLSGKYCFRILIVIWKINKERMMKKKNSAGIMVVSTLLFFLPLAFTIIIEVTLLILTGKGLSWTFRQWISTTWFGFAFYGILGFGILKLNNKVRLLTIALMIGTAIAGPLGLIFGTFLAMKENILTKAIERCGVFVPVIFPWLMILPISLLCASIAFYLTRPKVKKQFK